MAETLTANFGWTKPDPGASPNTWGATLNADLDKIDAQVFANQQGLAPIGSGALWFSNTPPANWLICNGASLSTTGTYAALFAVIGYAFGGSGANFNLPNPLNRFLLGASSTVALAATGGESAHTLVTAEIPAHAHPITDVAHNHTLGQTPHQHPDGTHAHSATATQTPHSHTIPGSAGFGVGPSAPPSPIMNEGTTATSSAQPAIAVSVAASGANIGAALANIGINASGTNLSTTQNAGGGGAHNNMPPFLGVNFIIRYA